MLWTVKTTQAGLSWDFKLGDFSCCSHNWKFRGRVGFGIDSLPSFLASGSWDSPVFALFHLLVLSLEQQFQAYVHTKKEERGRERVILKSSVEQGELSQKAPAQLSLPGRLLGGSLQVSSEGSLLFFHGQGSPEVFR